MVVAATVGLLALSVSVGLLLARGTLDLIFRFALYTRDAISRPM
jgi:hypothetical protein